MSLVMVKAELVEPAKVAIASLQKPASSGQ
jgi:hypothetical protein